MDKDREAGDDSANLDEDVFTSYWEPRVMRHTRADGTEEYAIHEVYFQRKDDSLEGYTLDALSPREPSVADLKNRLLEILAGDPQDQPLGDLQYTYDREDIEDWLEKVDLPPLEFVNPPLEEASLPVEKAVERKLGSDEIAEIKDMAEDASQIIAIQDGLNDPIQVIEAIDGFVSTFKKRREGPLAIGEAMDLACRLGSRFGEELCRALGWEWFGYQNDEKQEVYIVAAPDRSLICFPVNTLYQQLVQKNPQVTILLMFNLLKTGSVRGEPGGYLPIG